VVPEVKIPLIFSIEVLIKSHNVVTIQSIVMTTGEAVNEVMLRQRFILVTSAQKPLEHTRIIPAKQNPH
jgi:hypothetical protein